MLSQRPAQRLSQSLAMTPRMRQSLRMLQLSNLRLTDYIEDELEKNPLLRRDEDDGPPPGEAPATGGGVGAGVGGPPPAPGGGFAGSGTGTAFAPRGGGAAGFDAAGPDAEAVTAARTLRGHLYEQLGVEIADPAERLVGARLIEALDESGYLVEDPAEVAAALGCAPAAVEAVLARLREFDPPGVFARSLAECLAQQLADRGRLGPAMRALLDNLERLARGDLAGLAKRCGVDGDGLRAMVEEIRTLDPKPGLGFETAVEPPAIPDILMRAAPDGSWTLELNPDTLPRVLVDDGYRATVSGRPLSREDRAYLAERRRDAGWLVGSLRRRATTILKVAGEIVRRQDGFFRHGAGHLRPLVLREVADAIGMHESTVSRATSDKYMATPRGLFELKWFFAASIASAGGGGAHSAEAVRRRIRRLIDGEPADKALSDDRLVEILRGQGVEIARRTVAKYREAMRIPSSVQRRRQKALRG